MKKLLEKYLKEEYDVDYISINHWSVDGAVCEVVYFTDEAEFYREQKNINVWDMLIFLNNNK
tara:strand:+ start:116 stop:301 length:186 start_codon:yes stop_codon:yes gene_type:complete